MKPFILRSGFGVRSCLSLFLACAAAAATAVPSVLLPPRITGITLEADALVVTAEVPDGVTRVRLEGSRRGNMTGWMPRASRVVTTPGEVTFRISLGDAEGMEMFRLRTDDDALPSRFFTGPTEFEGSLMGAGSVQYPPYYFRDDTLIPATDNSVAIPGNVSGVGEPRAIAESDVWKIRGDTLYFFNQTRGLQVIDIARPEAPMLQGTLSLPASGEELYTLDENHVVLLARARPCANGSPGSVDTSAIVVSVQGGAPVELARVPLTGQLLESRLVGHALYLATDVWQPDTNQPPDNGAWIHGTALVGVDLADPAAPVVRSQLWIAGSGNVVSATDQFLLLGTMADGRGWGGDSDLHVLDIRDPAGGIREYATIPLTGQLADKFKLHLQGDVLTVITAGPKGGTPNNPWRTLLVNYRLNSASAAGDRAWTQLGSVELGHGENLYATRFDGERAYIVTFRQIDPLWIVDLSDPDAPRVLGELEVPGWSTYIHPMGDRLLTVGMDISNGSRTAVQLFDVSDPTAPRLLSRVPLGETWSWSEANTSEKALAVFPESGLVLLPFSSSTVDGTVQGVQLLDLGRNTLSARGLIPANTIVPRRSTLRGDTVLALSSRDLVAVDVKDRDHPAVTATLTLAHPVDRVVVAGEWLLEFSGNEIRVRAASAEDGASMVELGPGPVLGAVAKEGRLYVLQGWTDSFPAPDAEGGSLATGSVTLSVWDASALPVLRQIGSSTSRIPELSAGAYEALWPRSGVLVWDAIRADGGLAYFGGGISLLPIVFDLVRQRPVVMNGTIDLAMVSEPWFRPGIWWMRDTRDLLVYDVADPGSPHFVDRLKPPAESIARSSAHVTDNLLFYSHDTQTTEMAGTNVSTTVSGKWVFETREGWITNKVSTPYQVLVTNLVETRVVTSGWLQTLPLAADVQAAPFHVLSLTTTGEVSGWGDNRAGQLGSDQRMDETPVAISLAGPATSIAGTAWFSLARLADGTVWTWGSPSGPSGPPAPGASSNATSERIPHRVTGLPDDVVDISAGYEHAFARSAAGGVFAWGRNDHGQLGVGDQKDRSEPVPIGLEEVRSIRGGALHSVALTTSGKVFGWGDNAYGQVVNDGASIVTTPVRLPGLDGIVSIDAGDWHSVALDAEGRVWSWGGRSDGEDVDGSVPQIVGGIPPMTAIAAGRQHTVGLDRAGIVWAWGDEFRGAVSFENLPPIRAIRANAGYALALAVDETCYLWRYGNYPAPFPPTPYPVESSPTTLEQVRTSIAYRIETNVTWGTIRERQWREVILTNEVPIFRTRTHHHLNVADFSAGAEAILRPTTSLPGSLIGVSHGGALVYTLDSRAEDSEGSEWHTWLEAGGYDGIAVHLIAGLDLADSSKGASAIAAVDPRGSVVAAVNDGRGGHFLEVLVLESDGVFARRAMTSLKAVADAVGLREDLVVVSAAGDVSVYHENDAGGLDELGDPFELGCLIPGFHQITGDRHGGLWAPLGEYGVAAVWRP